MYRSVKTCFVYKYPRSTHFGAKYTFPHSVHTFTEPDMHISAPKSHTFMETHIYLCTQHVCLYQARHVWPPTHAFTEPDIHYDDVIKWKHFPRHWPFVRGIHRSLVNSPHKGQWRGALMFSLICARINGLINNRDAGDLRCHRAHYDVIVIILNQHKRFHPTCMPAQSNIHSTSFQWDKHAHLYTFFYSNVFTQHAHMPLLPP